MFEAITKISEYLGLTSAPPLFNNKMLCDLEAKYHLTSYVTKDTLDGADKALSYLFKHSIPLSVGLIGCGLLATRCIKSPKIKWISEEAIPMTISLAVFYIAPSWMGTGIAGNLLGSLLYPMVGDLAKWSQVALMGLNVFTHYGPRAACEKWLPPLVDQYGPAVYLIAPTSTFLWNKREKIVSSFKQMVFSNDGEKQLSRGHAI